MRMEGSQKNRIKIRNHQFLIVGVLALLAVGFLDNQMLSNSGTKPTSELRTEKGVVDLKFWVWVQAGEDRTEAFYANKLKDYKEYGIDAVIISDSTDPNYLKSLGAIAEKEELQLYTWTLLMEGDENPIEQSNENGKPVKLWHVEILYPMTSSSLDGLDFDCIGQVAQEGNDQIKKKDHVQYLGKRILELPPSEFKKKILKAQDQGAEAISFFETSLLTSSHWKVIKELKTEFDL